MKYLWSKHRVAKDYKDAVRLAVNGGLNVRTEFNPPADFILPLRELVREGAVTLATLDSRVRDVLRVKFIRGPLRPAVRENPAAADRIVRAPRHLALALRASRESLVLLKNEARRCRCARTSRSVLVVGPERGLDLVRQQPLRPVRSATVSVLDGIRKRRLAGDAR